MKARGKSFTAKRFASSAPSAKRADLSEGRKADAALYVMLEREDLERYKTLAAALGVTMRDFVRAGLEMYWNLHQVPKLAAEGDDSVESLDIKLPERSIFETPPHDKRVGHSSDFFASHFGDVSQSRSMLEVRERLGRLEAAVLELERVNRHREGKR